MPRSEIQASVSEAIDWGHLGRATLGNPALAREVLQLFVEQVVGAKAALQAPSPDAAALAHQLKGSARGIGAGQVAAAAAQLEDALRSKADSRAAADALQGALDVACEAIAAYLRQP